MTQAAWQDSRSVLSIVAFVHDFRAVHNVIVGTPTNFVSDECAGTYSQLVYNKLMTTPEFEGEWNQFEDLAFASQVAVFCDAERPCLDAFRARLVAP